MWPSNGISATEHQVLGYGTSRPGDSMINFASIWEGVADRCPDADAAAHGDEVRSWCEFDDRAARLAAGLRAHGVGRDDTVALYLFNGFEYLEVEYAAFKNRAVPCNVNYRYLADELAYLLSNADAAVVFFDHTLADRVIEAKHHCPHLRLLVQVGGDQVIDGAVGYEELIAGHDPAPRVSRSGDDLWFLYTGGTTGSPKAVMWRHRDLIANMGAHYSVLDRGIPVSVDDAVDAAVELHRRRRVTRMLAAAPLMHGTSGISALQFLTQGGMVATLTGRSFDADELWMLVAELRLTMLTIVGDAFARPMLSALDAAVAAGRPHDLSSLHQILSSGVMWSNQSKQAFLSHKNFTLLDTLGSSEAVGFASQISRRGQGTTATARFALGPDTSVITDDGHVVQPGSGEVGRLANGGAIPLGYFKDPVKTAETFPTIDGRRWSIPGDYATVEVDGTITLLGRGSVCINSGGEKIYPEEVEEALKSHPSVRDANVVGLPDERWGQAVVAVLSIEDDHEVSDADLVAHTRTCIAAYKSPKHLFRVPRIERSPNGKADYRWARSVAAEMAQSKGEE